MNSKEGGMPLAVGAGESADGQLKLFGGMGESAFRLQLQEILEVGLGEVGEEDAMGEDPLRGKADGAGSGEGTVAFEEAAQELTMGQGILGAGLQEEGRGPGRGGTGLGSAGVDHDRLQADTIEGETKEGIGAA
jgi:hypothetical protein